MQLSMTWLLHPLRPARQVKWAGGMCEVSSVAVGADMV